MVGGRLLGGVLGLQVGPVRGQFGLGVSSGFGPGSGRFVRLRQLLLVRAILSPILLHVPVHVHLVPFHLAIVRLNLHNFSAIL